MSALRGSVWGSSSGASAAPNSSSSDLPTIPSSLLLLSSSGEEAQNQKQTLASDAPPAPRDAIVGSLVLVQFSSQEFFKGVIDQVETVSSSSSSSSSLFGLPPPSLRFHINYADGDSEWCPIYPSIPDVTSVGPGLLPPPHPKSSSGSPLRAVAGGVLNAAADFASSVWVSTASSAGGKLSASSSSPSKGGSSSDLSPRSPFSSSVLPPPSSSHGGKSIPTAQSLAVFVCPSRDVWSRHTDGDVLWPAVGSLVRVRLGSDGASAPPLANGPARGRPPTKPRVVLPSDLYLGVVVATSAEGEREPLKRGVGRPPKEATKYHSAGTVTVVYKGGRMLTHDYPREKLDIVFVKRRKAEALMVDEQIRTMDGSGDLHKMAANLLDAYGAAAVVPPNFTREQDAKKKRKLPKTKRKDDFDKEDGNDESEEEEDYDDEDDDDGEEEQSDDEDDDDDDESPPKKRGRKPGVRLTQVQKLIAANGLDRGSSSVSSSSARSASPSSRGTSSRARASPSGSPSSSPSSRTAFSNGDRGRSDYNSYSAAVSAGAVDFASVGGIKIAGPYVKKDKGDGSAYVSSSAGIRESKAYSSSSSSSGSSSSADPKGKPATVFDPLPHLKGYGKRSRGVKGERLCRAMTTRHLPCTYLAMDEHNSGQVPYGEFCVTHAKQVAGGMDVDLSKEEDRKPKPKPKPPPNPARIEIPNEEEEAEFVISPRTFEPVILDGKRPRKQAETFRPSFLNDRTMLELQAAGLGDNPAPFKNAAEAFRALEASTQNPEKPKQPKPGSLMMRRAGRHAMVFEWWMDIDVGDEIEGNWRERGQHWPGQILNINVRRREVSIRYEDGDIEAGVKAENIRVLVDSEKKKEYMKRKADIKKLDDIEAEEEAKKQAELELVKEEKERLRKEALKLANAQKLAEARRLAEEQALKRERARDRDRARKAEKKNAAALVVATTSEAKKASPVNAKVSISTKLAPTNASFAKVGKSKISPLALSAKAFKSWPQVGQFVKVKYTEGWYYGTVLSVVYDLRDGLVEVDYGVGEIFEEPYPGSEPGDFVIISEAEYKTNKKKEAAAASVADQSTEDRTFIDVDDVDAASNDDEEEDEDDDERPAPTGDYSKGAPTATQYSGVWAVDKVFIPKIRNRGKLFVLGKFKTAQEAAMRYDDVCFDMFGNDRCNTSFGAEGNDDGVVPRDHETADLIGVQQMTSGEWRARMAVRSMPSCGENVMDLGSFDSVDEAVRAYDQMCMGLRGASAICNDLDLNYQHHNMIETEMHQVDDEAEEFSKQIHTAPQKSAGGTAARTAQAENFDDAAEGSDAEDSDAEDSDDYEDSEDAAASSKGPARSAFESNEQSSIQTGVYQEGVRWHSRIVDQGQVYDLGSFDSPELATAAYQNSESILRRGGFGALQYYYQHNRDT